MTTPEARRRPPTNKWLVTLSVTFGTLMGTIDASIVNVAVPHMAGELGQTVEEITWIATGFAIATVLVMPLTAFLGRFFGQKRVYMFSLALFVVGSLLCGTASSLEGLVAFRVVQGLGAGALQPSEQAILRQTFPPEEQGLAMAFFGMAVIIGPAVGPTLGGYIVDNYSWRWIFYINLPIGILGLIMVSSFVQEPEDIRRANHARALQERSSVDWSGIALLAIGLSMLQYVLEQGNQQDWFGSTSITVCAVVAACAIPTFIVRELTARTPVVDLRLFGDGNFLSGTLISGVMFSLLFAITFLLPVFMEQMLGFTAMETGMSLAPRALVMFVVTPIVGRLYNRVAPRAFVIAGVLIVSYATYEMSGYTLATGTPQIVRSLMVQGLGFSFLFVPLTTIALSTIPRYKLTDATGLNSLIRQMGGSVGLAVFATLLTRATTSARAAIVPHLADGRPALLDRIQQTTAALSGRGFDLATARSAAEGLVNRTLEQQAAVLAFERVFLLCGVSLLAVVPLALLLRRRNGGTQAEVELGA